MLDVRGGQVTPSRDGVNRRDFLRVGALSMAGLTLATIPMLALYFAGQKYFIKGLVAGAVK
jgi:ABC-type glycerol-3-phosphate transport system permease component